MNVRLAVHRRRPDQEIRSRPHNGVSEGSNQSAGVDEVVNKGLAAKRYALSIDRRLNHLFVLADRALAHQLLAAPMEQLVRLLLRRSPPRAADVPSGRAEAAPQQTACADWSRHEPGRCCVPAHEHRAVFRFLESRDLTGQLVSPQRPNGRVQLIYRLAFSNVIISLRVTVTHLVVTGGPPPAMCQAA